MNTQHLARAADPLTSHMAAARVHKFAPSQYDRILAAIRQITERQLGATAAEIAGVSGLSVVQIDRRLPELKKQGRAVVLQYEGDDLMRNGYRCWALV